MNAYISRNEAKTCEDMAAATVINFYKNHQIFGDFVASELRTLRSNESRKKLKRMIQKAILQVGEEEDVNIITG